MPHYNREILVPYLKDVCSAELLCRKLEQQKNESESKLRDAKYYQQRKPPEPVMPIKDGYTDEQSGAWKFLALAGICYVVGIICPKILLFAWCLCGYFIIRGIYTKIKQKEEEEKQYNSDLRRYDEAQKEYDQWSKNRGYYQRIVETEQRNISVYGTHLTEANQLKEQLYSVNIIPAKYRNAYAAYYLYDYFNTSREDDLTQVLQTMLLEEIIKRLDKVIEQQENIIIGQQRTMAMMEQQNKAAEQHRRSVMNHIAQIEQNQEQQTEYLQMIEAHERTKSFFAYATYLDEIKR